MIEDLDDRAEPSPHTEVIRWLCKHHAIDAVIFMVRKNPVTLTNDA